jgi:hypothetical protein
MYVCINVYLYVHMYTNIYISIYVYIFTYVCLYVCVWLAPERLEGYYSYSVFRSLSCTGRLDKNRFRFHGNVVEFNRT